ncbi:MAG: hypothetical protein FRX49_06327 [Trebouxia sp. A1-2]|nr:MAG: hypothetical protein FRX49_06327 [Trebouxia sp. A1-2]
MGVDVQKEMRLNAVSHIIARDVDDKSSKKLEHARKPDWAATISIVNCKWIYDCIRQWKMLPSGAYMCNCSDAEANSWHGKISAVGKQQADSRALGDTAKVALVVPSAVLISPLQGTTANAVLGQMPSGTPVATAQPEKAAAVPMPATAAAPAAAVAQHLGSALKVSKPFRSTATPSGLGTGLGTGPSSNKRQVVRDPVLLQPDSAEDLAARPDRESIGGTQGAITGLTHLALQKHNQDLHLRTGASGELLDLHRGGEALEPEELVGRAVQQQFEEGLFKGIVKKYNKKHRWFLIEYEDGDRQDLTWKELQPIMLPDVLVRDPEAPSAHPAKPKRKLQKVNTHTRDLQARPTASDALTASPAATAVLPSAHQAAARVRKSAKASSVASAAAKGKAAKAASAAAGKGKRARRHSSQDDEEAVLADEPIRSNTPAGARANAGNSPWSTSKKKGKAVLALGSMHTRDQQVYFSKLTKIGVPCVTHKQCPGWKSSITHVVLPSLLRSVKSLAGMAGGCWILHADFVDACASAEALVEPDEFELEGGSELISAHAPRHWRERHAVQGVGAFHSLQVLMYGACDKPGPAREDIATIIQSGGGTVTKCEKPCNTLTKAIARGTHLAIMSTDRTAADPGVKQLLKARVPCASARFVVEWLAHPEQELSDYLLFDSEIEWASELVSAAAACVAAVKPHKMSPQI